MSEAEAETDEDDDDEEAPETADFVASWTLDQKLNRLCSYIVENVDHINSDAKEAQVSSACKLLREAKTPADMRDLLRTWAAVVFEPSLELCCLSINRVFSEEEVPTFNVQNYNV